MAPNINLMKNLFKLTPVILFLALVSCSKDVELPGNAFVPANGKLTPNSPIQFNASIDGIPYSLVLDDSTYMEMTSEGGSQVATDTIARIYHSIIQDTALDERALWVMVGTNRFVFNTNHILPTPTEFNAYFGPQNRMFGDTTDTHLAGAAFFMRDTVADVIWGTQGPQPGSFFRVDEIVADTILGQHHVKARMVFKCMLYDGSGATKSLTNGVFVGLFRNG